MYIVSVKFKVNFERKPIQIKKKKMLTAIKTDWEDPLEKEMATHSIILAWKILRTEGPGGLQSMGSQESDTT